MKNGIHPEGYTVVRKRSNADRIRNAGQKKPPRTMIEKSDGEEKL